MSERIIVAGPRDATFQQLVWETLDREVPNDATLVLGGAPGVDEHARSWAAFNGVKIRTFGADWETHGRAAGPIRNREMAAFGTRLIAFQYIDRETRGTQSMMREANKAGRKTTLIRVPRNAQ